MADKEIQATGRGDVEGGNVRKLGDKAAACCIYKAA